MVDAGGVCGDTLNRLRRDDVQSPWRKRSSLSNELEQIVLQRLAPIGAGDSGALAAGSYPLFNEILSLE